MARGNALGQDRMDTQCAAKEVSRFASMSEEQDWSSANRQARYLQDNKRLVIEKQVPEDAGEGRSMVGYEFWRLRAREKADLRRNGGTWS